MRHSPGLVSPSSPATAAASAAAYLGPSYPSPYALPTPIPTQPQPQPQPPTSAPFARTSAASPSSAGKRFDPSQLFCRSHTSCTSGSSASPSSSAVAVAVAPATVSAMAGVPPHMSSSAAAPYGHMHMSNLNAHAGFPAQYCQSGPDLGYDMRGSSAGWYANPAADPRFASEYCKFFPTLFALRKKIGKMTFLPSRVGPRVPEKDPRP